MAGSPCRSGAVGLRSAAGWRRRGQGSEPRHRGEIEVTALDDPAPADAAKPGKPDPRAKPPAAADAPAPDAKPAPADAPRPKPRPTEVPAGAPEKAADTPPDAPEVSPLEAAASDPAEPKSPARLACEKKGDLWVKAGKSSAHACVKRTKDSGKRCTSGKDCQGECLARSGTCAPYAPLFGCNEILQDDGTRMTLCLD